MVFQLQTLQKRVNDVKTIVVYFTVNIVNLTNFLKLYKCYLRNNYYFSIVNFITKYP